MLQIPQTLNTPEFLTEESTIKWDINKLPDYFAYDVKNEKLLDSICLLNHKATLGIVAASSEWVFWRLSKEHDKIEVAINAIETINELLKVRNSYSELTKLSIKMSEELLTKKVSVLSLTHSIRLSELFRK